MLEAKYEKEMLKADIELSKAAQDTLGYEMIYREWVEVISLYLINKLNLRQISDLDLEEIQDENFALMAKTGSRKQRLSSIPYMFNEKTLPLWPKDRVYEDIAKVERYWDYDHHLVMHDDKVIEEEQKMKKQFDYNVIQIAEANDSYRKKLLDESMRQKAKLEKERLRKEKEAHAKLLAAEKKGAKDISKSPMPSDTENTPREKI